MGLQYLLLFLVVRARRDPDRAVAERPDPELAAAIGEVRRQFDVELDVACHPGPDRARAQGPEPLAVGLALRGDDDAVRERVPEQGQEFVVTVHGLG